MQAPFLLFVLLPFENASIIMTSVLGYGIWSDFTIFGYQLLDFYDFASNNVIMPLVALLTCILIGYVVKTKYVEDEIEEGGKKFVVKRLFRIMILGICPVCMLIILVTNFFLEL